MKDFLLASVIVTLNLVVSGSDGLKCYSCTLGCKDPFNKDAHNVTDCATSCIKHVAMISGIQVVGRGCSRQNYPDAMSERCEKKPEGTVCICITDHCNAARMPTISTAAIFPFVAGVIVYKYVE